MQGSTYSFEPDAILDERDKSNLASMVVMPGYRVLHRLLRAEVDHFILSLINTDAKDDAGVIAAHRLAKAAAQFYEGITSRVNQIVQLHIESSRHDERPIDITENLLDLGDIVNASQQIPNLLEEGDLLNEH